MTHPIPPVAVPAPEPPHWLLQKLRSALDAARRTIEVDHPVREHMEAAMADIDFYCLMKPAAPIQHTHAWLYNRVVNAMFCRCGDRIELDHRLPEAIDAAEVAARAVRPEAAPSLESPHD